MHLKLMKTQNFFFFPITSSYDDGELNRIATVIHQTSEAFAQRCSPTLLKRDSGTGIFV